jgi:hypothetical protein
VAISLLVVRGSLTESKIDYEIATVAALPRNDGKGETATAASQPRGDPSGLIAATAARPRNHDDPGGWPPACGPRDDRVGDCRGLRPRDDGAETVPRPEVRVRGELRDGHGLQARNGGFGREGRVAMFG